MGGGAGKFLEVVLTWELEVLAIVMGGRKIFPRVCKKSDPVWGGGGGRKMFWTYDFLIL